MSKGPDLLSARNLILAAAGIFVLSVLGMCLSMLRPPDSQGRASDSFGTRGGGYRGLVETLEALGVPVRRELAPPHADIPLPATLVLMNPNERLVAAGPKYLQALRGWIERGGRVVVALSHRRDDSSPTPGRFTDAPKTGVLEALGIDFPIDVEDSPEDNVEHDDASSTAQDRAQAELEPEPEGSLWRQWALGGQNVEPPQFIQVVGEGTLSLDTAGVKRLAVPAEGFLSLNVNVQPSRDQAPAAADRGRRLTGSLHTIGTDGQKRLLVAAVRRGEGEIIVAADSTLFSNRLLAEADNSVLAAHLVAPRGERVIFDEFYHGLGVRGNPLYLLTYPGFAMASAGLLLVVGVMSWRAAVYLGPPLASGPRSRRDIGEYISAMSQFFCRGSGRFRFLATEVRDGVLRQICRQLKLPLDTVDLERITSALARRDRERARLLQQTLQEVDAALAQPGEIHQTQFLPLMQRLIRCL
jgi:hypothetical protein